MGKKFKLLCTSDGAVFYCALGKYNNIMLKMAQRSAVFHCSGIVIVYADFVTNHS